MVLGSDQEGRLASAEWIMAVDEKPDAAAMTVQAKGLSKMVNKGAHICVKDLSICGA